MLLEEEQEEGELGERVAVLLCKFVPFGGVSVPVVPTGRKQ